MVAREVDRYGMSLVGLTAAEFQAREACVAKEERVAAKWKDAAVRGWSWTPANQTPPKALKQLVRDGIPPSLRPALWLQFSGGFARQAAAPPGYYASLAEHSVERVSPPLEVDVRFADAWRSLHPGHLLLTSSASVQAAQRMTKAFLNHADEAVSDATLRYVGCLAAFLLAVMGLEAEEAAWFTLLALVEDRLPASFITQGDAGCVEQRMLEELLAKHCPRVKNALAQAKLDFEDLTTGWFTCLLACTLPAETTARVWDCLLCEGPKVVFRVALALFKMNEAALLLHGHMAARNFKWRVARTYAADALLQVAFQGLGSFPMAKVASMRRVQSGSVPPQLQAHAPATAAGKTSPRGALSRLVLAARPSSSGDLTSSGGSQGGSPTRGVAAWAREVI